MKKVSRLSTKHVKTSTLSNTSDDKSKIASNHSNGNVKADDLLLISPGQILSAKSVYESFKKAKPKKKLSVSIKRLKTEKSLKKKRSKAGATTSHVLPTCNTESESWTEDPANLESNQLTDNSAFSSRLNKDEAVAKDTSLDNSCFLDQTSPYFEARSAETVLDGVEEPDSVLPVYRTLDKFDYYLINSSEVLAVIPFKTCFYFKGRLGLTVLSGTAELQGYLFDQDSNKIHQIFSPRGSSFQCVRAIGKGKAMNAGRINSIANTIGITEKVLKEKSNGNVLLILRPLNITMVDYIGRLFPINILRKEECTPQEWDEESRNTFSQLCNLLDSSIVLHGSTLKARFYRQPDVWAEYAESLLTKSKKGKPIRVMLLGGKGVGKSTLLRFLVNQLLKQFNTVLVIDFDPGQPEFFPAGCVSASLLSNPLLGPNYTHLQQPLFSYFIGDANIVGCPEHYVQSCRQLLTDCKMEFNLAQVPTIINTMGFTSGIGLDVTLDLIRFSLPRQVLQISSRSLRRNFPALLDRDFVIQHQRGWLSNGSDCSEKLPLYELQAFYSAAELDEKSLEEWGFRPSELRQLGLISYFSKLSSGSEWSLMDAIPYRISWQDLAVCICHESVPPALTMTALNASLVALCSLDSEAATSVPYYKATSGQYPKILREMPLMPCLGYGVIRGIDTANGYIYLTSPEPVERLVRVNCLVMGGIRLPESLLLDASASIQRDKEVATKLRVPFATFGPSNIQPACRPYRKYNPVFTLRNAT